jgi:hypothetical protein
MKLKIQKLPVKKKKNGIRNVNAKKSMMVDVMRNGDLLKDE